MPRKNIGFTPNTNPSNSGGEGEYEVSDNELEIIPLYTDMPDYSDEDGEGYA